MTFCARNTNGKGPERQIRSTHERSYKIKLKAVTRCFHYENCIVPFFIRIRLFIGN
jgi:hypothetical protein